VAPVQLRLMTDIVGFDLTHVYLMLDVLDKRSEDRSDFESRPAVPSGQKHSLLRLTLPECHIFLRALREFNGAEGSIDVTTPVLEEAKRAQGQRSGAIPRSMDSPSKLRDMARPEQAASEIARESNLGEIIGKLNKAAGNPQR
jgi:hypothetical protein